jgi:hypothetical protein
LQIQQAGVSLHQLITTTKAHGMIFQPDFATQPITGRITAADGIQTVFFSGSQIEGMCDRRLWSDKEVVINTTAQLRYSEEQQAAIKALGNGECVVLDMEISGPNAHKYLVKSFLVRTVRHDK